MKGNRKRKWVIGLGVAGAVLVLLVICGFVGWQMLMTHFVHQYHRETCDPIELSAWTIGDYPADYHLDDVPWLATREWYCAANSLAMVAAQHGTDASTAHCSFLMGFTYGASEVPGSIVVQFFGEPEAGLAAAAPHLGLERRYYVTDDEALYLDALRYYLSQGYAVRLGLDVAVLYDLDDQLPHSDLLVGYDGTGFYIYETVCLPEFPCEPRHLPPGEKGLWVSDQTLLDAVLGQATMFSYPWRYSLTIFEEGPREDDLRPIWTRNGNLLIGGAQYGPRQGADAIEGLAANIEKRGAKADLTEVSPALEAAVYTRRANAAYLREAFAGQGDIEHAAVLFDRAADDYEAVLNVIDDGVADQVEAEQIAARLRDAAMAEREAGQIFLSCTLTTACTGSPPSPTPSSASSWVEEEVTFTFGPNELHGIMTLPVSEGHYPAIVLIYGAADISKGTRRGVSSRYFADLARRMALEGFAALRYDPPGVGQSTGESGFESLDSRTEEAAAALHYLQSRPDVRPDRVGLFGVSQGAWVIAMAAARFPQDVAFIISLSGSGVSVAEQQVHSIEAQSRAAGMSEEDVTKAVLFGRLLVDWQLANPVYRDVNEAEAQALGEGPWTSFAALVYEPGEITPAEGLQEGIEILKSIRDEPWAEFLYLKDLYIPQLERIPPEQVAAMRALAEQSLLNDPKDYMTKVHCPVLAIFGENDLLQPTEKSAALYGRYLTDAGNEDFKIVVIPGVGHSILLSTPGYWEALSAWLDHLH